MNIILVYGLKKIHSACTNFDNRFVSMFEHVHIFIKEYTIFETTVIKVK